jgi:hypothetical protein
MLHPEDRPADSADSWGGDPKQIEGRLRCRAQAPLAAVQALLSLSVAVERAGRARVGYKPCGWRATNPAVGRP